MSNSAGRTRLLQHGHAFSGILHFQQIFQFTKIRQGLIFNVIQNVSANLGWGVSYSTVSSGDSKEKR